ncbi:MATE family efflux transporter [Anaerovorax odorimutans]|uniref:MATE family efflux transporter n=1 Tax=Anaerovorax odorimutans TaxID=109327 RepID=UPI0004155F96|nr:MATE family efflux transporter [Anaerovorax odorimutans]
MDDKIKIMSEEKISKALLKFGIPAIIGMVITAIYNFVDSIFVGGLGTSAMGAASVAFPILMMIAGLGLTMGNGAASYISRLLGEGNLEKANNTASISVVGTLILGILVIIPSLYFIDPLLRALGATETIMPYAKAYSIIFISGSIFNIINITMVNILRAEGSAAFSMYSLLIGAGLNIVLDPIFIYGFEFGIRGAAIATVISQIVTTTIIIIYFSSKNSIVKISFLHVNFSKEILFEVLKIGIPNLIFQILSSVSMSLINSGAASYGDAEVAAMGIVNRTFAIGSYVIFGFSKGFQPIAGYNYGAKNYIRLKESVSISLKWSTIFCLVVAASQIVFAKPIIDIFSNDSRVLDIGARALTAYSIMFPTFGIQMIYMALFLSLGKAREGTLLSLGRQGIFLIPIILILPSIIGLDGILFAQAIADLLSTIVTLVLGIKINRELNNMEEEAKVV